jgi:hypothetical protein
VSLKGFHIFFITVSTLTAIGFAAWAFVEYVNESDVSSLALGIVSVGAAVVLVVYGRKFKQKISELPASR